MLSCRRDKEQNKRKKKCTSWLKQEKNNPRILKIDDLGIKYENRECYIKGKGNGKIILEDY